MSTTERRTGQRYKDRYGVTYRLTRQLDLDGERWESISSLGGIEYQPPVPLEAIHWPHMTLLSSPSASPASGPPEGYEPCPEACGSWKHAANSRCWACHFVRYTRRPYHEAAVLKTPDWTPPLESKPAEMGKYFGNEIAATFIDEAPAQEAPKVPEAEWVCVDCDMTPALVRYLKSGKRSLCDDCYGSRERSVYFDTVGSGTHYAGPERLPKAKLAHSMQIEDPALEDA